VFPHAQAALADASVGMTRLANFLGHRGSYAAAVQLHERIVGARDQALGPERPETLTARNDLAYWTGEAGDAAGARDQFAALLPAMERVLGAEHPETLTAPPRPLRLDRGGRGRGGARGPQRGPAD
jgi:hypothetical protein